MTIEFPPRPAGKAQLLRRIEVSRQSLQALLETLPDERLTAVLDEWSIADHLSHVTAWLGAARAAMQGQAMWHGLDLPRPPVDPRDWDALNTTLHGLLRDLPPADVMERWRAGHEATVRAIEAKTQAELEAPHVEPDAPEGLTVIEVVSANTYEHYLEHETWIREQLQARGMLPLF